MPAFFNRCISDSDQSPRLVCEPGSDPAPGVIRIGLLNNMPDGALEATERQFLALLNASAGTLNVSVCRYALPDVPRTEAGQRYLGQYYRGLDDLLTSRLDGLIVTGSEPRHSNLTEEPYWKSLTQVIDWAERNTYSTVWSCLAAHAAIFHIDGIRRHRLRRKRFGVFNCARVSNHHLTAHIPPVISVPHSRWNDIRACDITGRGYEILTRANGSSVDALVKQRKSLFVFFQGHPEYEVNTLLLEYRRDVGRYVRKERETYPLLPRNYFTREMLGILAGLGEQILSERREELLAEFTNAFALELTIANTWGSTGARIYGNWLSHLHTEKMRNLKPRRGWKDSAA